LLEQCTREQLSPLSFLELVLTGELERKDERRVTTMLKLSGLPSGKTLEDFDWSFQPRVDRCGFRSSWSRVSREADQVVRSKLITRLGGR
jgi:DNA replication protein DnaC